MHATRTSLFARPHKEEHRTVGLQTRSRRHSGNTCPCHLAVRFNTVVCDVLSRCTAVFSCIDHFASQGFERGPSRSDRPAIATCKMERCRMRLKEAGRSGAPHPVLR
ncbi:hypothetical protein OH77DRAFT_926955 [Trametes cingulata]|nr:hypothetical protein OH77DRAFT_926955 [Trametes cingulata]